MFIKYPRTVHLEGSMLQSGDIDLDQVKFADIKGRRIIVEEKIDGANCAISFDQGELLLQSRGHFLRGGPRERHFTVLKAWAPCHQEALYQVLGDRYVMYGEWMQAKHTEFYDWLPHYFIEFDVLDKLTGVFLSTKRRQKLLTGLPIVSVPVLWDGVASNYEHLIGFVGDSLFKSVSWQDALKKSCEESNYRYEEAIKETDMSRLSEGLYIKIEEEGEVAQRLKFVRKGFIQSLLDSESHWMERPLIENKLQPGVDIWTPVTADK